MSELRANLRRFMEAKKPPWNQTRLAREAQVSASLVSDILTGTTKNPRFLTKSALATALGVSVKELTGEDAPEGVEQVEGRLDELATEERYLVLAWRKANPQGRAGLRVLAEAVLETGSDLDIE